MDAVRRLHQGHFIWLVPVAAAQMNLSRGQLVKAAWVSMVCDDFVVTQRDLRAALPKGNAWRTPGASSIGLHVSNKSEIAGQALTYIRQLCEIEREVKSGGAKERQKFRQSRSKPLTDVMDTWKQLSRQKITDGSSTAKALDYSLRRWGVLTRFLDTGRLPIDNNWIGNQIRPIAIGRGNWLFAGSLRAGQRTAAVMSLIQGAKINGHDPCADMKDVLQRLPTHQNHQIGSPQTPALCPLAGAGESHAGDWFD